MSAPELGEVRALLASFRRSDLRDLWVGARDWSVLLVKPGGSAYRPDRAPTPDATPATTPATAVAAPHLGVVSELLPPDSRVGAGDRVAVLAVLDERRPVFAERTGVLATPLVEVGELVQFGQALVEIA